MHDGRQFFGPAPKDARRGYEGTGRLDRLDP